jgi:hypothetical protein
MTITPVPTIKVYATRGERGRLIRHFRMLNILPENGDPFIRPADDGIWYGRTPGNPFL